MPNLPPPVPALPDDAPTVSCPTVINASIDTTDPTQTGRYNRVAPVSACGMAKTYPGTDADPSGPHLFDVYRFTNPTAAAVCFNFTLSYGESAVNPGLDGGTDAAAPDAGEEGAADGGSDASVVVPPASLEPEKYMAAYGTFFPTDLTRQYLGDVGNVLVSPQSMGITVPANTTIDVVVYGILPAPGGVGAYTLSCAAQ